MEWMTSAEVAEMLHIQPATVYAYVSRGILRSDKPPGARQSRFYRSEVERLAGRRRQRAAGGEIVIESSLTLLDPAGHLFYRGREVTDLVARWPYERVAEWLWSGMDSPAEPWVTTPAALRAGRAAQAAVGPQARLTDRMRVIVSAAATTDALRHDRRPQAVMATARTLIAAVVDCLPCQAQPAPRGVDDAPLATRLWPRLSARRPTAAQLEALDTALSLLADHEMAASTFAARVAASTWADPYLVVLAGMSALAGPLHGGASVAVRRVLRDALAQGPEAAVELALRDGQPLPGIGHRVYLGSDPRAAPLLEAVREARPPAALVKVAQHIIELAGSNQGPLPNVDFALGLLEESFDMCEGAGEAIFTVARCAGLIGHAMEEYQHRLRYRPRAIYQGLTPLGA